MTMGGNLGRDPDELRSRFAGILRSIAAETGDPRWSRAAGVLAGAPSGRDRRRWGADIAEVFALVESGQAASINAATLMVAKSRAKHQTVQSYARQLRREIKKISDIDKKSEHL